MVENSVQSEQRLTVSTVESEEWLTALYSGVYTKVDSWYCRV